MGISAFQLSHHTFRLFAWFLTDLILVKYLATLPGIIESLFLLLVNLADSLYVGFHIILSQLTLSKYKNKLFSISCLCDV